MDNQEQAQTATPSGATPSAQPEFSITDLQNLRAIVDLASKRGAFAGAELSSVGQVFDRLNTFLNAVAPQQSPADGTADTTTDAPTA
jgi:hypothetical protein